MSEDDWHVGFAKSLGVFLNGRGIATSNERGEPVRDDSFYVIFNAHHDPLSFRLPEEKWGRKWVVLLNTAEGADHLSEENLGPELDAGGELQMGPWSVVLLKRTVPR
jgi:glycogen operon protein